MSPLVILVSGLPWTGKTSLARHLSEELAIPFFGRDEFKEILFDTLGIKDRDWSRTLGAAAYELLFNVLRKELLAGRSVMLESNFSRRAGSKLCEMQEKFGFACVRIICRVDEATRKERFRARWESWERHRGHVDDLSLREWGFDDWDSIIPTRGPVIEVDTTDFSKIPYADIIARLRGKMELSE